MTSAAEAIGAGVGIILVVFLVAFILGFIMAWPVLWIWNWMMPDVFGVSEITYWQAFWGSFLAKLIFPNNTVSSSK